MSLVCPDILTGSECCKKGTECWQIYPYTNYASFGAVQRFK